MLHYILQIIAFQVVFLLVYDLFLKRETFFNYNRFYLLGTAVLSLVLPFIKIESVKAVATKDFIIRLPEVIIGELSAPPPMIIVDGLQNEAVVSASPVPILQIIFYGGIVLAMLLFLSKIVKLYCLKSHNPSKWRGNILIVKLLKSSAAFSFFNTIFLGEDIPKTEKPTIIKHELVHVTQKHTLDLLFFELLRILFWFNPLVYMYQNRIKTLHEFIADAQAVKNNGKRDYYQSLLNQVFETNNLSFINTFFKQSLIKKRIVMLQKSKSKQIALIKYALLIPLVFGMLIYTSADVAAQEKETETVVETIVIQEQDLNEKALIDQYYKEYKGYYKAGDFRKILDIVPSSNDKFRMSLNDFAKFKAVIKVIHNDRVKENIEKGTATDLQIERLKRFESQDKTFAEYIERTKTEEYGLQWEKRTEGSTLKLYVKDANNKTKEEKARFNEKIALIEKDDYWNELIISDGKTSTRMVIHEIDGKVIPKPKSDDDSDVIIEEIEESIEVPFSVIENAPVFPECKDLATNDERKTCTSEAISKFVNQNFNTGVATQAGLSGRQRISVMFKINEEGNIESVGARAPHPQLEDEAKRVVGNLPKFIPGMQRGRAVTVPYMLPILFQVQDDVKLLEPRQTIIESEDVEIVEVEESVEVPFSKIEVAPTFDTCKDVANNEERKSCTSNLISQFVNKNFNTDLAITLGLEGRQRIFVGFKIGPDGKINSVFVRAPHPQLEDEAERVIKMLPQFIPGTQRGKAVTVPYALPILFEVSENKSKDKN
jgi:hypothetical protein